MREVVKLENGKALPACGHKKPAGSLEEGLETDCAVCLFDPSTRLKFDCSQITSPLKDVRLKALRQKRKNQW